MKRLIPIIIATLALTACGSKTYYVTSTEVPKSPETGYDTTDTTDAPIATPAPSDTYAPPVTWSEEDEFIADVNNGYDRPIYLEDQDMIDAGYATCEALRSGSSAYDVLNAITSSADGNSDTEELLATVVASSVVNFCPEQQYKFNN
jgi:hypothetical protein